MRSLVTTCMNREHHLRRSLPHWLTLPGIDEIVIVDWSTAEPIDDVVKLDQRIQLIRVEDEAKWVQTYPTNLGIARARGDVIFKCDADCLPTAAAVTLTPRDGRFYAGDWRRGTPLGKASVNGQCSFTKAQWSQVNGYHEMFRRYSRDDVDFYDRLVAAGHTRHEIPVAALDFIPHDDADRVSQQAGVPVSDPVEALIHRTLAYHETINIVLGTFHPWGRWYSQAPYETLTHDRQMTRVRRDSSRELPIAAPLWQIARVHGLRAVLAQQGVPPATASRLDETGCLARLTQILRTSASRRPVAA
jgi:hypothetical protein